MALPLVVQVLDADGNPVPDAPVVFSITSGGGQLQASSSASPKATVTIHADNDGKAKVYFQTPNLTNADCQVSASISTGKQTFRSNFMARSNDGTGFPNPAPNDVDEPFDPEHPPSLRSQSFAVIDLSADVTTGSVTKVTVNDQGESAFATDVDPSSNNNLPGVPNHRIYTWKNGKVAELPPVDGSAFVWEGFDELGLGFIEWWEIFNLRFLTSSGQAYGDESIFALHDGNSSFLDDDETLNPAWWTSTEGTFFLPLPDSKKLHRFAIMNAVSDKGRMAGWGRSDLDHEKSKMSTVTGPFGFVGDEAHGYVIFDPTPDYDDVKLPDNLRRIDADFIPVLVNDDGWAVGQSMLPPNHASLWDGRNLIPMKLKAGKPVGMNNEGQVIIQDEQGEGTLWDNGVTTILRNHLSPYFRARVGNIQPYSLSNQAAAGSDATIHLLATAQCDGKKITLVCERDNDGEWTFSQIHAPEGTSNIQFVSINSSGCVAALGSTENKADNEKKKRDVSSPAPH